jgi:hypothetical protein
MIYDHTNMWANIQTSAQPWAMEWNIDNDEKFQPFFGLFIPHRELATLQVGSTNLVSQVPTFITLQVDIISADSPPL